MFHLGTVVEPRFPPVILCIWFERSGNTPTRSRSSFERCGTGSAYFWGRPLQIKFSFIANKFIMIVDCGIRVVVQESIFYRVSVLRSCWRVIWSWWLVIAPISLISSVKSLQKCLTKFGLSFIKIRNKRGPNTEPWSTLLLTVHDLDLFNPITILCF